MYLIFDTETTGLPKNWNAPYSDLDNWPRAVQIAWQLHDELGNLIEAKDFLIQPDGFDIPFDAERIHGISTALAQKDGVPLAQVVEEFNRVLDQAKFVVGQNIGFDINIMGAEFIRANSQTRMHDMPVLDTLSETTAELCKLPGGRGGKYKWPTLTELHNYLFGIGFGEAHNATADVEATTRCFFELIRREVFTNEELQVELEYFNRFKIANPDFIQPVGLTHINLKEASAALKVTDKSDVSIDKDAARERLKDVPFVHLHNHTQFTVLQSTMDVNGLVKEALKHNMPAVALTDIGNMMAAFHFEKAIAKINKGINEERKAAEENGEPFNKQNLMPIIGCEMNVCKDRNDKTNKDNGYQIVFLAKNKNGYHNLIKMASIAHTEGMYYVPRIDKSVVEMYKEDIIVLTGGLSGEVPNLLLNVGERQAEEALLWWREQFGEDLYVEVLRHGQEDEDRVFGSLIKMAEKHGIKTVAANNTFYGTKEDANTQDILLCVRDGEQVATPKGKGRNFRFGLENEEYYFKSQEEMKELFLDLPEAIESIKEILDKIEHYPLAREVLLPAFEIPDEFKHPEDEIDGGKRGENAYLRHLTYEGAAKRYPEITDEIRERLDFELATVERTGYPGYFLIVQDFCQAARDMGVSVGPGRGSAAGSAVAYCTGITNVDPIKYDLLFERFLNPDRVSMPDIDIDFDDEGRGRVIDWVIKKYGANQVAQIITYGTMAAKSSIRDAGRVLDLPLPETGMLGKLLPDNVSLKWIFSASDMDISEKFSSSAPDLANAMELRRIYNGNDLRALVLQQAVKVEGTLRNTGIHACGVIITPDDITNFVPVSLAKDTGMWCTQFDNSVAEEAGLLKMDFLGLKTLTLIKDAVKNVKMRHGIDLDPDTFPIDDGPTYELFQRGETVGVFQYESPGMQKYMRELKPTVFGDLIAMNALYRPGPLEYIPDFVKRKNGEQEIVYDLDACEEYLKDTYGITVYQEQVMLLSQKLAGFTKGDADVLRKAMGKKQRDVLDKMKPRFIEQGAANGHDSNILEKIWKDWEAFASYAFNKSHSTCYAWVAYQTAYLKANYPAEFMAAVLSNNLNDISQVRFFMEECKRMGIEVSGPDVNESEYEFTVNAAGAIRFGLGGIKGLGSGPVENILQDRKENGPFRSIFEMTKRLNLRLVNKKALESMAYAGCFDSFKGAHRANYFAEDNSGRTLIENAIKFGAAAQENENSSQFSMFGDATEIKMPEPQIPSCPEWSLFERLKYEQEVVGIFISGHPLDDFKSAIDAFCNGKLEWLQDLTPHRGKELIIPAIISQADHAHTKKGDPFGILTLEDYTHNHRLYIFQDSYLRNRIMMVKDLFVALKGRVEESRYPDKITKERKLEFVLSSIEPLSEILKNNKINVNITIGLKELDQLIMTKLEDIFNQTPGNSSVQFTIVDRLNDMKLNLPSRKLRVEPSAEMLNAIKEMNLEVKLEKA
jgi:DNA polymerase III subunit alpha